jgi:hypothetical protein
VSDGQVGSLASRHRLLEGRRRSAPISRPCIPFLAFLALIGCSVNRPITGTGGLNTLTRIEIQKSGARNALELIRMLRPSWLLASPLRDPADPTESGSGPGVLINDVPVKPLFSLQFESLENITEIRYLTRTSAENRYRVSAPNGLIVIIRPPPVGTPPDTGRVMGPTAGPGARRSPPHG